jgi:hypothetical protein
MQAEERENGHNNNDQPDEIDYRIHGESPEGSGFKPINEPTLRTVLCSNPREIFFLMREPDGRGGR